METNKIYTENCLETLSRMPNNYLDCVVTSPPYYGLRDYGHDEQIGLEDTPGEYVAVLTAIFEEVRRALKPTGVFWLNLGDSYSGTNNPGRDDLGIVSSGHPSEERKRNLARKSFRRDKAAVIPNKSKRMPRGKGRYGGGNTFVADLPRKNLLGIPWRVAFSLQEAGWYLRQDIVWHKTNPMPESVKDRCTKAHEYVFLLTKSDRYFFDSQAIAEIKSFSTRKDKRNNTNGHRRERGFPGAATNGGTNLGGADGKRNKRSVWSIATQPFPKSHFATFPETLAANCILSGCPSGGIVYDPFMGAGTVALVAARYQRQFIGSEINQDYVEIAKERIYKTISQTNMFEFNKGSSAQLPNKNASR